MKTATERLKIIGKIRKTLSLRKNWTQVALARNKHGKAVDVKSKNACRWCLYGALDKNGGGMSLSFDMFPGVRTALHKRGYASIVKFNDDGNTTHKDIISFLDDIYTYTKKLTQKS